MEAAEFDNYTERLRASLEAIPEVVGLITLGSTCDASLRDEWSDHDFWIITQPGAQEPLVDDLSWLPDYQNIAITVQHGKGRRTIVLHNRHKCEFAVFAAGEVGSGKIERYEVLIDRDQIAELIAGVHTNTRQQEKTRSDALENLCVLVWSACERHSRGELLSARQYVDGFAINQLLSLIDNDQAGDKLKDALDPRRRLEARLPGLAAELLALRTEPVPETAFHLLLIAERELKPNAPALAWDTLTLVKGWIAELLSAQSAT